MKEIQELLTKTTCYVNGQTINGRVLAVDTYVDKQTVCFLFDGDDIGNWMPELALFSNCSLIIESPLLKKPSVKILVDIPETSTNKQSQNTPGKNIVSSTLTQKEIKEIKKDAHNDINGLVDFLINTPVQLLNQQATATGQAIEDLNREVNKLAKGTQEVTIQLAQETHQSLVKSVSETTGTLTKITTDTHATVVRLFDDTCATTIKLTETTSAAFVKFPNDTYLAICGTTEASTKTLVKIFEDTQNSISSVASMVKELTDDEIIKRLNELMAIIDIAIRQILESLSNQWNRYWKQRILNSIQGKALNFDSAKEIVNLLRKDFPNESKRQLADRLIFEKSVFATVVSLINQIPVGGIPLGVIADKVDKAIGDVNEVLSRLNLKGINVKINLLDMNNLMVEMIYQISYTYGFEQFSKSDIFAIFAIIFSGTSITALELDFLTTRDIVPLCVIEPIANLMLLLFVGNMACEFFEMKSKRINPLASEKNWKILEAKRDVYTDDIISRKQELEVALDNSLVQMLPA